MSDKRNPPFSPEQLSVYRKLRLAALQAVRRFNLSDASYHATLAEIISLDQHIKGVAASSFQKNDNDFQTAFFAAAARAHVYERGNSGTINAMLDSIVKRRQYLLDHDLFHNLAKGGAQIQKVLGAFVPTDPDKAALGPGESGIEYQVRFHPKAHAVISMLLANGLYADDMTIYHAGIPTRAMRQRPYTLIEIPRLNKQIAVCDQIGEITFVASNILPISVWAHLKKDELRAHPDITDIRYDRDGRWLVRLMDILSNNGTVEIERTPKITLPKASKRPLLTIDGITIWIELYKEKTGKHPSQGDKTVWDKNEDGIWREVENETWVAINSALSKGLRGLHGGSTLAQLKDEHGLVEDNKLTTDSVLRWIELYKEKTGKYPSQDDKTVWDKNEDGTWREVENETWVAIDGALRQGFRGLHDGSSLAQLKDEHGFNRLTTDGILRWIELYKEKTEKYPSTLDKTVWDKNEDGTWREVENETWGAIDATLRLGLRGLHGGSSLAQLRDEHGLVEDNKLTTDSILRWIKLYKEKTGKHPSQHDKTVWDKNEDGIWREVENKTWMAINGALRQGFRGLHGGSTLAQLRDEHGLVEDNKLTTDSVLRWIELYKEKTGKYPSTLDKTVWDKNEDGTWREVENETWVAIDGALRQGFRGLSGGSSLAQLKDKHGLVGAASQPKKCKKTSHSVPGVG